MKTLESRILGSGFALLLGVAAACSGTSTGNPMNTTGGAGGAPPGASFLKSKLARDSAPNLSAEDASTLARGNRAFAFDLYRKLSTPNENLFFSPFSVSVALAMIYPGARGETESQIAKALHFELPEPTLHSGFNATLQKLAGRSDELLKDSTGTGFKLEVINQAWGQQGYPFLGGYLDVLAQNYGAGLYTVDFADSEPTRQLINQWVEDNTESRVKDLLPSGSLTSDTRLVLTNAIYFKGSWLEKFDAKDTTSAAFHGPAGDQNVAMMHQVLETAYSKGTNYQAVELPYISPAVRMLLILPASLDSLPTTLDEAFFQNVRGTMSTYTVTLALPKFQFESSNELKAPLASLGMPLPFTSNADFGDIAGGIESLFIDEVYHKAFVAVDEQGTEAAAATAVVGSTVSVKPEATLTLDRPFVFAIFDEPTGQILFLGQVVAPNPG